MHLNSILRKNKLSVIFNSKLFKSEKADVAKDLVQNLVVAVSANWILFEEDFNEDFKKILISDTTVEQLLNEHFFIWILEVDQKVVSMGVDGTYYRVECFDTLVALFN